MSKLPCLIDGKTDVQAAHIRSNTGGGMGLKPGDNYCVPLCCSCHNLQHEIGERKFWGRKLEGAIALSNALFIKSGDIDHALKVITRFRKSQGIF